jgi:hypothetical protein
MIANPFKQARQLLFMPNQGTITEAEGSAQLASTLR